MRVVRINVEEKFNYSWTAPMELDLDSIEVYGNVLANDFGFKVSFGCEKLSEKNFESHSSQHYALDTKGYHALKKDDVIHFSEMCGVTGIVLYVKNAVFDFQNRTKGNWSIGKNGGCVVSTEKTKRIYYDESDFDVEREHYGGYLVCESIAVRGDEVLIAQAPTLLKHLQDAVEILQKETVSIPNSWLKTFELIGVRISN